MTCIKYFKFHLAIHSIKTLSRQYFDFIILNKGIAFRG